MTVSWGYIFDKNGWRRSEYYGGNQTVYSVTDGKTIEKWNYCPNCGAKMDEVENGTD